MSLARVVLPVSVLFCCIGTRVLADETSRAVAVHSIVPSGTQRGSSHISASEDARRVIVFEENLGVNAFYELEGDAYRKGKAIPARYAIHTGMFSRDSRFFYGIGRTGLYVLSVAHEDDDGWTVDQELKYLDAKPFTTAEFSEVGLSADGSALFGIGGHPGTISLFSVDKDKGTLTPQKTWQQPKAEYLEFSGSAKGTRFVTHAVPLQRLFQPQAIAAAHKGNRVFIVCAGSEALHSFVRDERGVWQYEQTVFDERNAVAKYGFLHATCAAVGGTSGEIIAIGSKRRLSMVSADHTGRVRPMTIWSDATEKSDNAPGAPSLPGIATCFAAYFTNDGLHLMVGSKAGGVQLFAMRDRELTRIASLPREVEFKGSRFDLSVAYDFVLLRERSLVLATYRDCTLAVFKLNKPL